MAEHMRMPYRDFTVKAKLHNPQSVHEKLLQLKARFIGLDRQSDYYFKTPKGKLKLRKGNIENLITHYERIYHEGMEQTLVYRYDLNPTPEQQDALFKNHEQIGLITKERSIYQIRNQKIHVDRMPDGGSFLEIESIDREGEFSDEELRAQCRDLLTHLEIDQRDLMPTGYLKN